MRHAFIKQDAHKRLGGGDDDGDRGVCEVGELVEHGNIEALGLGAGGVFVGEAGEGAIAKHRQGNRKTSRRSRSQLNRDRWCWKNFKGQYITEFKQFRLLE